MSLYLIKRGPRPDYHKAPYHPVILCARKPIADWEAGCTCKRATVWGHGPKNEGTGWLLLRWHGLVIDYGPGVMHGCSPTDEVHGGFYHDRRKEPWTLLAGAVWWDDKKMPDWLRESAVVYPPDDFTQQRILDFVAEERSDREHRNALRRAAPGTVVMSLSVSGFGRPIPDFWPKAQ
jgi:hypothetical protein